MNEKSDNENQYPKYYSLMGAADLFSVTVPDIINLAIAGKITLSVKIDDDCSPYLMSVADTKASEVFSFIFHTNKSLKNISMLPKSINATHVNLNESDCKMLKTSTLDQRLFKSVVMKSYDSCTKHEVINRDSNLMCALGLDVANLRLKEKQVNDHLTQSAEMVNKLPPEMRGRFIAGVRSVQLGEYVRRFVLITNDIEVEDLGYYGFMPSSKLSQSNIKKMQISQNDIVISSNYLEVLEKYRLILEQRKVIVADSKSPQPKEVTIDDIPTNSPYYLPPNCRYSTKLIYLAILGFSLYENESLPRPKNVAVYVQSEFSLSEMEAATAAFFINPNPSGKMKKEHKHQVQFEKLVKIHQKFYCRGKLKNKSTGSADNHIPNSFEPYGYSRDNRICAAKLIAPDS